MDFHTWEPVYERILTDFDYDRAGDEQARDVLAELLVDASVYDPSATVFAGETVAVAGGGPNLADEIPRAAAADSVVAASVAAETLADHGVAVDMMVTDLDKVPDLARELTAAGIPVAAHAHGDNIPAVQEHVPAFDPAFLLPTTQAAPRGPVRNFGGFTDGDRAAFLADALGAEELTFPGWEFDDPAVGDEKARKLRWAEVLLLWLERRRGEQFAVLDGRRDGIDTAALPNGGG